MNRALTDSLEGLFSQFQDTSLFERYRKDIDYEDVSDETICIEIRRDLSSLVAPHRGIERIIVGREEEINWLKDILDGEKSSINLIQGDIGSGKTLLLNLIREMALEGNYAVAKIEISKVRTIGRIDNLYSYILNNICIPEQPTLIGRLELVFKKIFFRLYDSTYSELLEWGKQHSYPQHRLDKIMKQKVHEDILKKISTFISEVKQIDIKIADDIEEDIKTVFNEDIMGYDLSLKDFRLHKEKGRSSSSIYAFNYLINYAGYCGLVLLIDEMEQDRNIDTYNTIYSVGSNNYMGNNLKIVIAGTNDLIEDPILGVRQIHRDLYETFKESGILIGPLPTEDQKKLCIKILNILRIAGTINETEEGLVASQIDDIFNDAKFKKGSTVRDLINGFISYVETEHKHEI